MRKRLEEGHLTVPGIVTGVISAWLSDDELGPIPSRDFKKGEKKLSCVRSGIGSGYL